MSARSAVVFAVTGMAVAAGEVAAVVLAVFSSLEFALVLLAMAVATPIALRLHRLDIEDCGRRRVRAEVEAARARLPRPRLPHQRVEERTW